ncbi:unnamed protein product [Debaryomyces tyrocola]|nr:unnamed protein product [Debaryomyces tyrocola]
MTNNKLRTRNREQFTDSIANLK